MLLSEAIKLTTSKLELHSCVGADASREALELIAFVTDKKREQLHDDVTLTDEQQETLNDLIARRINHEPLSHLLGTAVFLGREFEVSPDVLIPRPATEIIVSKLIDEWREKDATIYDIGTGSGCAAISIALELPQSKVIATDISLPALVTANQNAKKLHVAEINFLHTNLIDSRTLALSHSRTIFFANLPYIPTKDINNLDPDVRDHEPRTALDGGPDGLDLYRELFEQLPTPPTAMYLEALPDQLPELADIAKNKFPDATSETIYADSGQQSPVGLIIRM